MKYIISNFNNDLSWISAYTDDYIIYDQSNDSTFPNTIVVPHGGSDIKDKMSYIIDNYDNLPDVFALVKGNLFKYITKEEFDLVKDNKTFTPLLTQNHRTYSDDNGVVCFYKDGMYHERNDYWYLRELPTRTINIGNELKEILGFNGKDYLAFAPGSNYIVTRKNIHKHPKELYERLRKYVDLDYYPGEAQLIERGLYNLWS